MNIPMVIEQENGKERAFDIFSRILKSRIVIVGEAIDEFIAANTIAQLLHLEAEDPDKDILMYINSPGGVISDGMAIYDTMQYIKPDVSTIVVGMAASMGSILLAGGAKGKRMSLPNAEIMVHQPWGGAQGTASDIEISANHIKASKKKLYNVLSHHCNKPYAEVEKACDRDNYMTPQEALEFGIIDKIITKGSIHA